MRRFAGAVVLLVAACAHEQEPPRVVVFTPPEAPPPPPAPPLAKQLFGGEAVSAADAPLPIHGGTVLIAGPYVWVASPDAGTVDVISMETSSIVHTFALGRASQPGRMAEDPSGAVAVVLRGEGSVATMSLPSHTVTKRSVCSSPRGIAFANSEMLVACATGELVTISGSHAKTVEIGGDLRDVASDSGGTIYVTRMRRAEIVVLDRDAAVQRTLRPREAEDDFDRRLGWRGRYVAHVAWKMDRAVDGSVLVLHQYEATREIPTEAPPVVDRFVAVAAPYAGFVSVENLCGDGRLVVPAMTRLKDGAIVGSVRLGADDEGTPFDFASSPGGIRLVHANGAITKSAMVSAQREPSCASDPLSERVLDGTTIAIAEASDVIAVQSRNSVVLQSGKGSTRVMLSSNAPIDTGWQLFHEKTESGLACMTCHPEGGEDGHTWAFTGTGSRRTQSLRGGLLATAPFHWSGDMNGMPKLANDIFTKRMGGGSVNAQQAEALGKWLDRLPAAPKRKVDQAVAMRGRAIFASSGCSSCHSGEHLTNNESADVGTGGTFQVPSLVGLAARAPYMHDGCASTIVERFTRADCGGTDHGDVKSLRANHLFDLVSYLESL